MYYIVMVTQVVDQMKTIVQISSQDVATGQLFTQFGRDGFRNYLASYPDLLTAAFVFIACSTNEGESLVKLITSDVVPGRVKEWHTPSVQL